MKTKKMTTILEDFLKTAFCIDGECCERGIDKLISKNGEYTETLTFKLNDSKRGEFLVSISRFDK